jgi:proteasome lid subunit RPN8/RPN11
MRLEISREALDGIRAAAAAAHPEEACGLLFGGEALIDGWQEAPNVAQMPKIAFEIEPATLFAALRAERAGGPKLMGYWHSHPNGRAEPSATDSAAAAPDGKLWLIVGGERALLWRAVEGGEIHGRFDPVRFDLRSGKRIEPDRAGVRLK